MAPLLDPRRRRRWPLLLLAVLCILPAGAAYFWQFLREGIRGVELLRFTAQWVAIPLGLGLVFLFAYLNKPHQH